MTLKEIIVDYLTTNGFDGVCNCSVPCGCSIEDFPCWEECVTECEPAYKDIITESNIEDMDEGEIGDIFFTTTKPEGGKDVQKYACRNCNNETANGAELCGDCYATLREIEGND